MTAWLQSLKLSLVNWLSLTAIGVIGLLLVLLRGRTIELHRARMALLKAEIDNEIKQDDERVAAAREAYEQALKDYEGDL